MTVYETIAWWLFDVVKENGLNNPPVAIDVELMPNEANRQNTALFSSPNDIHTQLCGGQMKHIETKTWYLRRRFFEIDNRKANEQFMEALRKAITMKALRSQMPKDGRKWRKISVEGGIFVYQRDENLMEATYSVTLRLEYIE